MLIGDKYKIESDNLNVTVYELHKAGENINRKTGEPSQKDNWTPILYFSNFKNALHGLIEREIMDDGFKDFQSVCEKIEELHGMIDRLNVGRAT